MLASLLTIFSSQPVSNTATLASTSMDRFAISSVLWALTPNHPPILARLASLRASRARIPPHVLLVSQAISSKEAVV